jgi:hypothetical protein
LISKIRSPAPLAQLLDHGIGKVEEIEGNLKGFEAFVVVGMRSLSARSYVELLGRAVAADSNMAQWGYADLSDRAQLP